ncbi:IS4 family transposase [Amycolatopsis sp.]|uniref:IS4 family transposase n=1 Tax=Amycolatopsis sp. TaxID=37632 RepID=UPI002DFF794F|nr:IS4 family transposase [Amycolatopsis sp.]
MGVLWDMLQESDDRLTDHIGLGVMTRVVSRDLVDEVLNYTEKNEKRSRLLPARVVVYYVLALTLFYGDAYEEVLRKLVNGLQFLRAWRAEWVVPTTGAISKARVRLGVEPLKELFSRIAVPIATPGTRGAWYHGHRVMAIDGVILDAPDTEENVERFEKNKHSNGESAYPQVRIVGLAECGTHAMVAAEIDSWRIYERELTERLLDQFEPNMLVLADRGFYSYDLWKQAGETGAALVWRVMKSIRLPVLEEYSDGSYLSELLPKQLKADLNKGMKRRVPEGVRIPVRVIEYRIGNRKSPEIIRLITTLLDHKEAPAAELAALYAERWEFEIGLDEIETHQIANYRILRSKRPDLVEQEIWGLLITHYIIRHLMHQAADDIDIDEDRLSFIRSLRVVRRSITNDADFPPSTR